MLWKDVLYNWEHGIILQYPKQVKGRFQWNTSVLKNNGNTEYKQSFRTNSKLAEIQNYSNFLEHIDNPKNRHMSVIAFPNPSKDTILIIPMPVKGKNYASLRDFIDNAPETQQQELWKKVAQVAKTFMNKHGKVWVSVHGLGVAYTHIRVAASPKYYFDAELTIK